MLLDKDIREPLFMYLEIKQCFVNDYHLIQLKEQIDDIRSEQLFSRASMDD